MTNNSAIKLHQSLDEQLISNIRSMMSKHNITEAELARRANIPQPTLHKILAGKTADPRISTLKAIADYFSLSMDELYSGIHSLAYMQSKPETQSIPILSWSDCLKGRPLLDSLTPNNWERWTISTFLSRYAYGLISKPSMEPRFPRESTLIIASTVKPSDGDLVVVHYPNTHEATLREIAIDGPTELLISITDSTQKDRLVDEIKILGVLLQSQFSHHA